MQKAQLIAFCVGLICILSSFNARAQNADINLLKYINSGVHTGPDKVWRYISDKSYLIDAAVPVTLLLCGYHYEYRLLKRDAYAAGASLLVAGAATLVLKEAIRRDRPATTYPDVITQKTQASRYSFPSMHTSMAFATATSLSMAIPKWYVIAPSFAYAGAIGYSRMYLGTHYPSDVLGGAVVGAGSAYLSWKAQQWLIKRWERKHPIVY
ncbi:phosphatase PAP2 family protein [Mucilaginibacter robiniae]|uniref:Phosphatase PAP2 family protein n=1 Tax=Mucilaginibacter robiniae TaxID=2728022 RepID=A0A7L5E1K4_9SPHI|nr:phosphatase PAP2 family protein [Mucilaginibacter robiniae]QJD94703.1 phosphatase PAP2 family protein [Mucilaginibacter robiniae]